MLLQLSPQISLPSASASMALAVGVYLLTGLVIALVAPWLARWLLRLGQLFNRYHRLTAERVRTLEGLIASLISLVAIVLAVVASFSLFVEPATLIWLVGLFSAAFGLAARGTVADLMAGAGFIFHNTFAIDEKIEFYLGGNRVEGTIETVNVRNTLVRAPTGELFTVPNGEIGVVRNFTRANLSATKLKLNVPSEELGRALDLLEALGRESANLLPDLRDPWQVISTSDTMGAYTEITLVANTSFAQAATLKLRMIDLIFARLRAAGINLRE